MRARGRARLYAHLWTATTLLSNLLLFSSLAYITHYAGHMSIRVHRRTRDLRSDLDKGAAGNTGLIIAFYFVHLSNIYSSHICRTGAIKGMRESDAFACRFGRQRRR